MANNIFDKVRENIDIATVISQYVDLIPKGKNLFGLCPFHDDSNPSMSVSREKGIFTCFVCKKSGDAIKFVEEYKHLSRIEATLLLAKEYHIDVSEFNNRKIDENKKYYEISNISYKFFSLLMNDDNYSKEARTYLNNRGISDNAINDFGICLSPSENNSLYNQLINKGYLDADIEIDGLSYNKKDIFNDRIIIPIRDEIGRVIAFGGRIYKESQKDLNKYLNSKETPIFKKGQLVFNLDRAAKTLKSINYLIIVEGYMDIIQLYSKGIYNCVALMGTSLTDEQTLLIKKYTKNVVVCLDGDKAGVSAVKGVIKKLDEHELNYSITILKDNLDPDEYLRKYGKDAFLKEITNNRLDKTAYLYYLIKLDYPVINSFNMESFKRKIFDEIKNENSNSFIELYIKKLSQDINISYDTLMQDFNEYRNNGHINYKKSNDSLIENRFKMVGYYVKAEKMIIDYSIKSFDYFEYIENYFQSRVFLRSQNYKSLFIEIGDIYDSNNKINKDDLIIELKKRNVYNDYIYNDSVEFSFDDLKNNIISSINRYDIDEKIEIIKNEIKNVDIASAQAKELQTKLMCLLKEKKR